MERQIGYLAHVLNKSGLDSIRVHVINFILQQEHWNSLLYIDIKIRYFLFQLTYSCIVCNRVTSILWRPI